MLATSYRPQPFGQPDGGVSGGGYRPVADLKAFNELLPPPIEFVEGSSTGALAVPEGKYVPINTTPPRKVGKSVHDKDAPTAAINGKAPANGDPNPAKAKNKATQLYLGALNNNFPAHLTRGSGLYNTGNSCFLNSALQVLLHTPPLLHILDGHKPDETCRVQTGTFCMACVLRSVAAKAHDSRRRPFTPTEVTNKLLTIAKHMRRGRQEDSHEFLRYAIDALQKACLAGHPPKLDAKTAETTWVHKLFGGRLRSRVHCLSCGHNSDTFDSILDLSLDIGKVTSLQEALKRFVTVDHLRGSDKYKCEKCKQLVDADKQFTIHQAPHVLTVQFKRFSPLGRKIGGIVAYPETLKLQSFMSQGQVASTYTLFGVICHAGGGPNSGHYYAYIKAGDRKWYEMNDDLVSLCHQAPLNRQSAYMLFYLKGKLQGLDSVITAATIAPAQAGSLMATRVSELEKLRQVIHRNLPSEQSSVGSSDLFIGPLLPSQTPKVDRQAAELEKKINAAVANSKDLTTSGLGKLVAYSDDSDDEGVPISHSTEPPESTTEIFSSIRDSPSKPPVTSSVVSSPSKQSGNEAIILSQSQTRKRKSPEDDRPSHTSSKEVRQSRSQSFSPLSASSSSWHSRESGNPFDKGRKFQHNSKVYGKHGKRGKHVIHRRRLGL